MPSKFAKLSEDLYFSDHYKMPVSKKWIPKIDIFLGKKLLFPYTNLNTVEKLKTGQLSNTDSFFNDLTNTPMTKAQYEFTRNICVTFKFKNLQHLLAIYLKVDIALLTDVIQAFRHISLRYYRLDTCQYFVSLAQLSWQAALKFTNAKIELLSELELFNFIRNSIRGGTNSISCRYAQANDPEISNSFNPNNEVSYIQYNAG